MVELDPGAINDFESGEEIEALRRLAPGRVVLEVGTFRGFSAVLFALAGARAVHSVDWHLGGEELGDQDTLSEAWANLGRYGVRDRVVLHVGRSEAVLPLLRRHHFDVAFVDGGHSYAQVRQDTELVWPLVRPGGQIVWHDAEWPEIRRAVVELTDQLGAVRRRLPGSLLSVEVPGV